MPSHVGLPSRDPGFPGSRDPGIKLTAKLPGNFFSFPGISRHCKVHMFFLINDEFSVEIIWNYKQSFYLYFSFISVMFNLFLNKQLVVILKIERYNFNPMLAGVPT